MWGYTVDKWQNYENYKKNFWHEQTNVLHVPKYMNMSQMYTVQQIVGISADYISWSSYNVVALYIV